MSFFFWQKQARQNEISPNIPLLFGQTLNTLLQAVSTWLYIPSNCLYDAGKKVQNVPLVPVVEPTNLVLHSTYSRYVCGRPRQIWLRELAKVMIDRVDGWELVTPHSLALLVPQIQGHMMLSCQSSHSHAHHQHLTSGPKS